MLFSKDIRPVCGLCAHAVPIDEETVLCRNNNCHTFLRFAYCKFSSV